MNVPRLSRSFRSVTSVVRAAVLLMTILWFNFQFKSKTFKEYGVNRKFEVIDCLIKESIVKYSKYPNNIKNKCHRIVLIIDPGVCLIANNIKIKYHWFNMNYVECSVAYLHNLHISIYTVDYEYHFIRRLKFLNSSNV